MIEDLHPKDMARALGRLIRDRFTILGIVAVLLSLAGAWDLIEDVVYGRATWLQALETVATNLGLLLDSGLVRLILLTYGLFLLARAAHRLVRADEERALRTSEANAQLIAEQERRGDEVVERVATEVHEIVGKTHGVTALLAKIFLAQQSIEQNSSLIRRAQEATQAYGKVITEIENGACDAGWRVNMAIDGPISMADEVFSEAQYAILGSTWPARPSFPEPHIDVVDPSEMLCQFDPQKNKGFLQAHKDYLQRLRQALNEYQSRQEGEQAAVTRMKSEAENLIRQSFS